MKMLKEEKPEEWKRIDSMTWKEIVTELKKLDNCCIDSDYFVIPDLKLYLNKQSNFLDNLILNGKNPQKSESALFRKKQLKEVLLASKFEKRISPVGEYFQRIGSVYPLKE